ncbi:MAG: c-type cytochrome [Pseudomonadota bacterium]|nr:c-type cytochrome [Pseudomonadota bacterium]
MMRLFTTVSLIATMVIAGPALAQGDVEAGRVLADTCMGCHGAGSATQTDTYPSYPRPKLGGQQAEYIVAALKAYKSGERTHATMQAQAASLTEAQMRDMAAYFAAGND